jgi:hypothetical protein
MTIRHTVRVGQQWESNDPRRPRFVRVTRILNYVTGRNVDESRIAGDASRRASNAHCMDRVEVEDMRTKRVTTIRRDQFATGVRGWTLLVDVHQEVSDAA